LTQFAPAPAPIYGPVTGCALAMAAGSVSIVAANNAFFMLILSISIPATPGLPL